MNPSRKYECHSFTRNFVLHQHVCSTAICTCSLWIFSRRKSRLIGPVRSTQIDFEGTRNDIYGYATRNDNESNSGSVNAQTAASRNQLSAPIFRADSARRWFLARQKATQRGSALAPVLVIGLLMRSTAEIFAGNNRVQPIGNYRLPIVARIRATT